MAKKIKYIIHPGYVISKHDGDRHLVTARDLMHLYGVDPSECMVATEGFRTNRKDLISLSPRYDGNYDLVSEALKANP